MASVETPEEVVHRVTQLLEAAGVPHMVTGSLASGHDVLIASAEDILIAKLEWAKLSESDRQLEDAAGILRVQGEALDVKYVERWVEALGLESEFERALVKVG